MVAERVSGPVEIARTSPAAGGTLDRRLTRAFWGTRRAATPSSRPPAEWSEGWTVQPLAGASIRPWSRMIASVTRPIRAPWTNEDRPDVETKLATKRVS